MTVTYDYYKNVFGGELIPAEAFPGMEITAARYVHKLTFYRLVGKEVPDTFKMAICAAAEVYYGRKKDLDNPYKSENNDGYSVTYADDLDKKILTELRDAVSAYLPPSDPLRYAGVN